MSRRSLVLAIAIVFAVTGSRAHGQDLFGDAQVSLVVPTTATSAGFVYRYDPVTGAFQREANMAAQPFLERPEPVGDGHWNFNLSYLWFKADDVDGADVDAHVAAHVLALGATYGVTKSLDLNLTVPVMYFEVDDNSSGEFNPIFLRAKYQLVREGPVQLAAGLVVRMLTKSIDDDDVDSRVQAVPAVYVATESIDLGNVARLRPYLNLGVTFDEDLRDLEPRWGVGLDCGFSDVFTAAVSVLGRHRINEPSGFSLGRTDIYDATFGGRVNIWSDRLTAFAHAVIPLNNDGVRADVIPIGGLETTF